MVGQARSKRKRDRTAAVVSKQGVISTLASMTLLYAGVITFCFAEITVLAVFHNGTMSIWLGKPDSVPSARNLFYIPVQQSPI
jgi:hypothetical protein